MVQTRKRRTLKGGANATLQNVLGLVAAQGYSNTVPLGSALSKNARSNYLTSTLRNKKWKNYFKNVSPQNQLKLAIEKRDPYAVRRLLEEPGPIKKILKSKGAIVSWHDPVVKNWKGENSSSLDVNADLGLVLVAHTKLDLSGFSAPVYSINPNPKFPNWRPLLSVR